MYYKGRDMTLNRNVSKLTKLLMSGGISLMLTTPAFAAGKQQQQQQQQQARAEGKGNWPTRDGLKVLPVQDSENHCNNMSSSIPIYKVETDSSSNDKALGVIGTALVGAAITAGVDFIGEQISEAAMEKTDTFSANYNYLPKLAMGSNEISPLCLEFIHYYEDEVALKAYISLEGVGGGGDGKTQALTVMKPSLQKFEYIKTASGKTKKARDIVVQLGVARSGSSTVATQSLVVGELETGNIYQGSALDFPLMVNPFRVTSQMRETLLSPVTFTVSVMEMKDASKALGFLSSVAEAANDDLTSIIIDEATPTAVVEEADEETPAESDADG